MNECRPNTQTGILTVWGPDRKRPIKVLSTTTAHELVFGPLAKTEHVIEVVDGPL